MNNKTYYRRVLQTARKAGGRRPKIIHGNSRRPILQVEFYGKPKHFDLTKKAA